MSRNKAVKSKLKTAARHFDETVASGNMDEAKNMLPGIYSEYDKSRKKKALSKSKLLTGTKAVWRLKTAAKK